MRRNLQGQKDRTAGRSQEEGKRDTGTDRFPGGSSGHKLENLTPKNLVRHELIGLEIEIAESTNRSLVGLKGTVVDETRNIIVLDDGNKERKIPKSEAKFLFRLPTALVKVQGRLLVGRPEDRIKKRF
ncbi:MAG: ribonuclease P protein component 1 [Candidatus Hydrothermarchaeales archaeon]